MKKIFLFIMILLLPLYFGSCSTEKDLEKKVYIYGYDFTDYTKEGFLFTPEQYLGEYESIGIIEVEIYPQIVQGKVISNQYGTSNYGEPEWRYNPVQTKEVLDSLFNIGKRMGADAIVRLNIQDVSQERSGFSLTPIPGKKASGFAIKRRK